MKAYFCTQTGVRIAAPGVSKRVDYDNGQDEVVEEKGKLKVVPVPKPKSDDSGKQDEPQAPKGAEASPAGAEKNTKPSKGGE